MARTLTAGFETTDEKVARVVDWMHDHRLPSRKAAYNLLIDLSLPITPALIARLDAYAARYGMTREAAVAHLMDCALAADPPPPRP